MGPRSPQSPPAPRIFNNVSPPAPRIFNNMVSLDEIMKIETHSDAYSFAEEFGSNPSSFGVSKTNLIECTKALEDFLFFKFENVTPVYMHKGRLAPKQYQRNGVRFWAYSPYDSLVHALSYSDVQDPKHATKENFFLPMAVAIAKVLVTLNSHNAPRMLCIVFDESHPEAFTMSADTRYLVGTTIVDVKQDIKTTIQQERARWVREVTGDGIFRATGNGSQGGQSIGHCAETHACIIKLTTMDRNRIKRVKGFALIPKKLKNLKSWKDVVDNLGKIVANPCENCQKGILDYYGVDKSRFMAETPGFFRGLS